MKILAVDTSTEILSLGVFEFLDPEEPNPSKARVPMNLLGEITLDCFRSHTEKLLSLLDTLLCQSGCPLETIRLLAVSIGPGSFTGLRVGLAAWKGLATATKLPLVGVPTLDAMTRLGTFVEGWVCPILDARMQEVFGAIYRYEAGRRTKLTPDLVCPIGKLLDQIEHTAAPLFFMGNGTRLYCDAIRQRFPQAYFVSEEHAVPRASAIAREAFSLYKPQAPSDEGILIAPIYLRKSQAEEMHARKTP